MSYSVVRTPKPTTGILPSQDDLKARAIQISTCNSSAALSPQLALSTLNGRNYRAAVCRSRQDWIKRTGVGDRFVDHHARAQIGPRPPSRFHRNLALARRSGSITKAWEELECHIALLPRIPRAIYLAHSSGGEQRDSFKGPIRVPGATLIVRSKCEHYTAAESVTGDASLLSSCQLLRPILPRSPHLPLTPTEGSLTRNFNKTGVRLWA